MKQVILTFAFIIFSSAASASAQGSWLDRPMRNWNNGNGTVPNAPATLIAIDERCREQIRLPDSLADRAVTRAGWSLFGASQSYGPVTMVSALAGVDGMCRPTMYNTFVFVSNRFAGTLSPTTMDSRTDGALSWARLVSPSSITADFARYVSTDPLCCPSQTSSVTYSVSSGVRATVAPASVETVSACAGSGGEPEAENVVSGTVTYRQRSALPSTAVVTVKLVDVSRADMSAVTIAETRIQTQGKQVPFNFTLPFDPKDIKDRNRYAVQAQIQDNERLLFISDVSYPVITQGNPKTADIVVVPVRGQGAGSRTLRGTVTYSQRSALPSNSTVTVRLVDLAPQGGGERVVAESTFGTNDRQLPLSFELQYDPARTGTQRNYGLEAEISTNGRLAFKTAQPVPVQLRGGVESNIQLTVVPAAAAITGKTLSLSKFGTGSMKIGDRGNQFLIRANVNVQSDGTAAVTVSGIDGSTVFTGTLTYFDAGTLRVTIESSGDADASGEIEIRYNGRSLTSVSGSGLTMDGQPVTLRF